MNPADRTIRDTGPGEQTARIARPGDRTTRMTRPGDQTLRIAQPNESKVRIALLFPDLLGTYGDRGNALVLRQRLRWRGITAEITEVPAGSFVPESCDLYVIGGGEDVAQLRAAESIRATPGLRRAVSRGAAVLAVCAGFQILGTRYRTSDGVDHDGAGLLDVATEPGSRRAIGEIVVESHLGPLSGFENHQGRTTLGADATALGRVVRGVGNGHGGVEGVIAGRVIGTYLHGPVLARNPALADTMLGWVVGDLPDLPATPEVERLRAERIGPEHATGRPTEVDRPASDKPFGTNPFRRWERSPYPVRGTACR